MNKKYFTHEILMAAIICIIIFSVFLMVSCGSADGLVNDNDKLSENMSDKPQKSEASMASAITGVQSTVSEGVPDGDIGNISNRQLVFSDGQALYYESFDLNEQSHIYRKDLKTQELSTVFNGYGIYLTVSENFLYFIGNESGNTTKSNFIYKVNLSDLTYEQLNEGAFSEMSYIDGWLYYLSSSDDNNTSFVRQDINSKKIETLLEGKGEQAIIYDNEIYYRFDGYIYKADLNGTNQEKVVDDWCSIFTIGNGKIIYVREMYEIKTCDMNGKNIKSVKINTDKVIKRLNSYDDFIYFLVYDEGDFDDDMFAYSYKIKKTDFNGKEDSTIYEAKSLRPYFNIVDSVVYTLDNYSKDSNSENMAIMNSMSLDGSHFMELER
ncbi:MAG: DUF5050 domain-containing protein [Clostridia bacterium]|nr:DUF5050 domain-containing protein [Clostridia bacterium]